MRRLENGPLAHGERLLARVAFVKASAGSFALQLADTIGATAMPAHRPIRPQLRLDIGKGSFFVLELRGVEDRFGHDRISYEGELSLSRQVCQV